MPTNKQQIDDHFSQLFPCLSLHYRGRYGRCNFSDRLILTGANLFVTPRLSRLFPCSGFLSIIGTCKV